MLRRAALTLVLTAPVLFPGSFHATQQPTFRTRALAVRVDVLVLDGRNPVAGLTAADFELRDNGIIQKIDSLDTAEAPLNVVLALDTSASVEGQRFADLAAATGRLLDGLRPADRAALITFDHAVMPRSGLSADINAVRQQLARVEPSGRTSVMDGVYVALTTTLPEPGRSLVVVFTDGDDVSSWLEGSEVVDSAARSNAVVYAVTSARRREQRVLEQLTNVTGGDILRVASTADLGGAFERILRAFRSRYVLSYTPSGVNIGGFHRLDVRMKRRGLSVKARPGYIGVEPVK